MFKRSWLRPLHSRSGRQQMLPHTWRLFVPPALTSGEAKPLAYDLQSVARLNRVHRAWHGGCSVQGWPPCRLRVGDVGKGLICEHLMVSAAQKSLASCTG